MTRRARLVGALALAALGAFGSQAAGRQSGTPLGAGSAGSAEDAGPRMVEEIALPLSSGGTAPGRVYELTLPTRRGAAGSKTLTVAYLRVGGAKPGEPVNVFLGSRPGDSGIDFAAELIQSGGKPLLELLGGDVAGIDTRGAGRARPSLDVASALDAPASEPLTRAKYEQLLRAASESAVETLRAEGIDLDAFHHVAMAADVRAVLAAMDAPAGVRLWARDFGALVALEVVREDPGPVRALILVSAEGPDQSLRLASQYEDGLAALAARVRANAALSAAIPDFVEMTRRVLERLEQKPARAIATNPETKSSVEVQIGRFDLEFLLVHSLGDLRRERTLPALVHAMDQNDFREAAKAVLALRAELGVGSALRWTTAYAAGASRERERRVEADRKALAEHGLLTSASLSPLPAIANAWPVSALPDVHRAPVQSTVPTLLIAGTLDVDSPPSYARELLAHLPKGKLVLVENAGSEVALGTIPKLRETVTAFLAGQELPREASVPSEPGRLAPPRAR